MSAQNESESVQEDSRNAFRHENNLLSLSLSSFSDECTRGSREWTRRVCISHLHTLHTQTYIRTFDDVEVAFILSQEGNIGNITNERIDCKLALFFLHMTISHVHVLLLLLLIIEEKGMGPMICIRLNQEKNMYCVYCTLHTAHTQHVWLTSGLRTSRVVLPLH